MIMSKEEIDRVSDNEREWRKLILDKIQNLEKNQVDQMVMITTLKTKQNMTSKFFSTALGFVGGTIAAVAPEIIKKVMH